MDIRDSAGCRNEAAVPTYALVLAPGELGIRCLRCKLVSWNLNDVAQLYCGNCKLWHSERTEIVMAIRAFTLGLRAARLGPKMPTEIQLRTFEDMEGLDARLVELERGLGGETG